MNNPHNPFATSAHLRRRQRGTIALRLAGQAAFVLAFSFIAVLLVTIVISALPAFTAYHLTLTPHKASRSAFASSLVALVPEASSRKERRELSRLLSPHAPAMLRDEPARTSFPLSADAQVHLKGLSSTRLSANQRLWLDTLQTEGHIHRVFHTDFFSHADSRDPENAGILGALVGFFFIFFITLLLSAPLAVLAAIYLEEFAKHSRLSHIITIFINNLAAVPSVVFGLLALALFLGTFALPRSTPLVGGMTLALLTLPTIIIAARVSLAAVSPAIREAALAIGASPIQTSFHHVLPVAMPGILTGIIIGMARAVGETAPLLMIGMVAFLADIPSSPAEPATTLPIQIFLWADSPERLFAAKTSAAILVMLVFLGLLSSIAFFIRRRFDP